jgi:hypothetical protein
LVPQREDGKKKSVMPGAVSPAAEQSARVRLMVLD